MAVKIRSELTPKESKPMPYKYQPETLAEMEKIPRNTVERQSMQIGIDGNEPLMVSLDSMLRYAKSHEKRFGSKIADDQFVSRYFLPIITGLRGMLSADGGVAHELDRSTDSKSNSVCEGVFWAALTAAGFTEADL